MWCVLKCRPGRAEEIMASCRKTIPGRIMQDIFVFTYDRMKRYQGAWHVEKKMLFPDYIFMETDDITALSQQLELYREFTLVLEDRTMLRRVEPEEEAFLRKLGGPDHHLEMSVGYIRDGVTHVLQRIGHPAVDRADQKRTPHYSYRTDNDKIHHEPGRGGGACHFCFPACRVR